MQNLDTANRTFYPDFSTIARMCFLYLDTRCAYAQDQPRDGEGNSISRRQHPLKQE